MFIRESVREYAQYDLERDLKESKFILEKCMNFDYCKKLYAALCNNRFVKNDLICMLKDEYWSCSWRYAGALVSELRGCGDYMDYYCQSYLSEDNDFLAEGMIDPEIRIDIQNLNWLIIEEN